MTENLLVMMRNSIPGKLVLACLVILFVSCGQNQTTESTEESEEIQETNFKLWTWITANADRTDASYEEEFAKYSKNGLDAVLINTNADPVLLERLTPLAKEAGLEVHAWMFTVNRPGDEVASQHPDWYAVSREGKSCYDDPPYVGYYKWLCPTRTASRNHILSLVKGLAGVENVASVHLDYIRYSDIFLPIGLLPKYDLVQNEELPEFDFCYCEVCVREFEKTHHKNPLEFSNPAIDMEWKQFRLNKVKAIVDDAYDIAHEHGKELTAAVFPYPEMADHMVRQRWDKWKIDHVLPMIYYNFYNEEVDWVGYATAQGVRDLQNKNIALHTGLYLPTMSAQDVTEALRYAKQNGAKGVAFFDGNAIKDEHFEAIIEFRKAE